MRAIGFQATGGTTAQLQGGQDRCAALAGATRAFRSLRATRVVQTIDQDLTPDPSPRSVP
ncbi:hypothetical protein IA64_05560 [Xanthomonas arboricola pv. celebensis]|nr:hypothetical protein IA64_05560 [Xanthomonas arboricola pv. celebensis]